VTTAYITHEECFLHDPGENHPECPRRLSVIHDALHAAQLYDHLQHHEAPLAQDNVILLAHSRKQLEFLTDNSPSEGIFQLDPDTRMSPGTLRAAHRAAGAVIHGVDVIMHGKADNAFCAVRPPGHHAERNRAMGFCFFNNVAIGALYALGHRRIERVAVLDFDAHFGNGTEQILNDDPSVLICTTFQHPLFPSRDPKQTGNRSVDVPLAAGSGSQAFRDAVMQKWRPALKAFSPDFIVVSAGFDAHADDPLTDLHFSTDDFRWVTEFIVEFAAEHAGGRVLSVLEGGYSLPALGACAAAHVKALMGLA